MSRYRAFIAAPLIAVALLGSLAFRAYRNDPVAVVVQVSGDVQVHRPAGTREAAAVGLGLHAGDRVDVPGGARAVLMYRTGRMQTATTAVTIAAPAQQESGGLYDRTVQTIAQVATTDVRNQPNRQGMIRPIPGTAVPIAPRNGVSVLDVRPALVWFEVPGANAYIVQIRRVDVTGARPARFSIGADTVWHYPADEPPLAPGGTYEWTVADAAGRPAPPVQFRVADAPAFARMAETLAGLHDDGVDPSSDGLFVLALTYREHGLFYEADHVLRRMSALGVGRGRIYHMLHAEVLDRLGDLDGAAHAFARADQEAGS